MHPASRIFSRSSTSVAIDHDDSSSSFIEADGRVVDLSNLCIGAPSTTPPISPKKSMSTNNKPLSRRRLLPSVDRSSRRRLSQHSAVYPEDERFNLSMPELTNENIFTEPLKRSKQAAEPQSWKTTSQGQRQQYQLPHNMKHHQYAPPLGDSASIHTRSTACCSLSEGDSLSHLSHSPSLGDSFNRVDDGSSFALSSRSASLSPRHRQRQPVQLKKPPPPVPPKAPTPRLTTTTTTSSSPSSSRGAPNNNNHNNSNKNTPVQIEVAPGLSLPLRGSNETMLAVDCGRAVTVSCFMCETALCCVQDCQLVLCPECRILSPVDDQCPKLYHSLPQLGGWNDDDDDDDDNDSEQQPVARNGVGLGLKVELLNF